MGSLSGAIIICRIYGLPDPRAQGSQNPGATNVLRLGGPFHAVQVLLVDVLKGTIPVYGSYFLGIEPVWLGIIAIAACLGHIYPIFFNFKGGKGVATAFGAVAPISPTFALMLIVTWIVTFAICRYSSLAAIITSLLAPIYSHFLDDRFTIPMAMLSTLIIVRHRANITRLMRGQEGKFKRGN
ncbi:glycerol-3-phosphate acyltransferase [Paraferrimonas haliotis]|uniref:Glycerol-3-phosphate acyltransferase n=2 Tax=Paraferrimonas haliotis TaxID=2013866 RepID=A0AA37WXH8_9GAMM|nr:glycerol-3-phosphate acyltransferase [Paraferrimonas haliotis]